MNIVVYGIVLTLVLMFTDGAQAAVSGSGKNKTIVWSGTVNIMST